MTSPFQRTVPSGRTSSVVSRMWSTGTPSIHAGRQLPSVRVYQMSWLPGCLPLAWPTAPSSGPCAAADALRRALRGARGAVDDRLAALPVELVDPEHALVPGLMGEPRVVDDPGLAADFDERVVAGPVRAARGLQDRVLARVPARAE